MNDGFISAIRYERDSRKSLLRELTWRDLEPLTSRDKPKRMPPEKLPEIILAFPKIQDMKYVFLILGFIIGSFSGRAQFAPQAGLPGSTAMHKDSSAFVDWASNCTVKRGWMNITDTTLGKVTAGNPGKAFGKADADIVSLGDAGEAVFFFENPIINGNGYDFAVFENGFLNPLDSNLAYLELAKIEVSNDGIIYYPFAAVCENDTTAQIAGVGEYMDARKLNNLAGKYVAGYGTPFDLDELSLQSGLDVNDIHYIK
ncbi:hypothetical protein EMGBS15_17740, partial [Filimonas sp.]